MEATPSNEYVCPAQQALHLKLVDSLEQAETDDGWFHPEYTHQVVGDSENIFGYKDLAVRIAFCRASMVPYVTVSYSSKVEDSSDVPPDDIKKQLMEWLPEDTCFSKGDFEKALTADPQFKPPGELVHSYTREGRSFVIYASKVDTPGFQAYHSRFQSFLIWYIEAASYILFDDENWRILHLLEETQTADGQTRYASVGFSTTYVYYAFPEHVRPRISQFIILPPYQKHGHGAELLKATYVQCRLMDKIRDICVEDPAPEFGRLRDFVDCKEALELPEIQQFEFAANKHDEFCQILQEKLKINKKQGRRIFELLWLRDVQKGGSEEARKAFRLAVKSRMAQPQLKERREEERELASLSPVERVVYKAQQGDLRKQLQEMYDQLREEYSHVLDRL